MAVFAKEIKRFVESSARPVTVNEVLDYLVPLDKVKDSRSRNYYNRIIFREIDLLAENHSINYSAINGIGYLRRSV